MKKLSILICLFVCCWSLIQAELVSSDPMYLKAVAGDAEAQKYMGDCYYDQSKTIDGKTLPKSEEDGLKWYFAAATNGYVPAQKKLADIWNPKVPTVGYYTRELQWAGYAADDGNWNAQKFLAVYVANHKMPPSPASDSTKTNKWLRFTLQRDAQMTKAERAKFESFYKIDGPWYLLAAAVGYKPAADTLARHWNDRCTWGTAYLDPYQYSKFAAQAGNLPAQKFLAVNLFRGNGMVKDTLQALQWLETSVKNDAQVADDDEDSVDSGEISWILLAALHNYPAQQNILKQVWDPEFPGTEPEMALWSKLAGEAGIQDAMNYYNNKLYRNANKQTAKQKSK